MLGSIIGSIAGNLVGGILGNKAQKSANKANQAIADQNYESQKEFAQNGVRWKVDDAKAAGIHPVYALGAQTMGYSPVAVGVQPDMSMANAFSAMGSDIGRAVDAKSTAPERFSRLQERLLQTQIDGQEIENAYRASQLSRLNDPTQMPPPMPTALSVGGRATVGSSAVERLASQFTSARSGAPWLEAAPPTPGTKEARYANNEVYSLPSEQVAQLIEDNLPYQLEHYVVNRLNPWAHRQFKSWKRGWSSFRNWWNEGELARMRRNPRYR